MKRSVELWIGCVAGALQETEYRTLLAEVGFEEIEVEPTRIYRAEDARAFLQDAGIEATGVEEVDGKVMSASNSRQRGSCARSFKNGGSAT